MMEVTARRQGPARRTSKTQEAMKPSGSTIGTQALSRAVEGWFLAGECSQFSPATLKLRRYAASRLLWFLSWQGHEKCGPDEVRQFFAYAGRPPKEGAPRWGDESNPVCARQLRPASVRALYAQLESLFRFLVEEEFIGESPLAGQRAPSVPLDQIRPFTPDQVDALIAEAGRSTSPRRDVAILTLLYDTGIRVSELCGLNVADVDQATGQIAVLGKGNKRRTVGFSRTCRRALWRYLTGYEGKGQDPLFAAASGQNVGSRLTTNGLRQLVTRLAKGAGVTGVRCSPHTFRHTYAVEFLRAGGNVFALQQLLGHANLSMTMRYVALAQADLTEASRKFSPADRLKKAGR